MRVDNPSFGEPSLLYSKDAPAEIVKEKKKYRSYAFALFNYLETIADKCHTEIKARERVDEGNKGNKPGERIETPELVETWGPILVSESWLHRDWFGDPESSIDDRFKPKFRSLVKTIIQEKSKNENESLDSLRLIQSAYAERPQGCGI